MILVEKLVLDDTNDENAYLVACAATGAAMIIDPGRFDERMIEFLGEGDRTLEYIYLTHGHGDHTGGVAELKRRYPGAQVLISAADEDLAGVPADRLVAHADRLALGRANGELRATPGHTPGGLTLVMPGYAFCGDALFSGSVGGTRSRERFDEQNAAVAAEILSLPDETIVCCGHGPSSTVGVERRYNSFFVR